MTSRGLTVSVIVPTLNEADNIAACVASVRAQRGGGETEVVVVDGGSTDGTVAVAAPLASVLASPPGRAVQMNAGARRAGGNVLLFLHADSRLPAGALAAVRDALADPDVPGGTFTLRFDDAAPLLRLYAACTRLRFALFHFGDAGIFVRSAVFERLGGFRQIPLMEDVDFLRRLRRAGRLALVPRPVTTSARRFRRGGIVRQQLLNAALVAAFSLGVSPARLARWYNGEHGSCSGGWVPEPLTQGGAR